ncbi:SGNH/GDSL hydrolase family protein [Streptomyces sp. DSM 44915]|uniref:SGNH/GDSL hydrolase family protein n=1 Tax=Streptomyces chisholmiae TaxID=3075540 RepID=A0ABU2JN42_9ACTN|nr:SGNH/GDSL hydrolase family protein [Streptomyces sp. DSM 44915]MDT0265924.1 SGNH/GDSL hydrolase family protein [Streptomyces sp. DSM 44915]
MHDFAELRSFVALGDSFTEGMSDALPDGRYRGWADLLAHRLGERREDFRYANLAVRGKLIQQIADEQVPVAAAMDADLVTLVGGLNDVLRPRCDLDAVCALLDQSAARLAPHCRQLVLMRSPGRQGPVLERYRGRMEALYAAIDEIAERHGALVVDLYASRALGDPRLWADDRLHLTADGHRRVAEAVWRRLGGEPGFDWDEPLPASAPGRWYVRRAADLRFARQHLLPWIGRRLTGRSSGDGRLAKRPDLAPVAWERGP